MALAFTVTLVDDFFQQLVQHLIFASGLDHAIVGEYQPGRRTTVDGQMVPNIGQSPSSCAGLSLLSLHPCTTHSRTHPIFLTGWSMQSIFWRDAV